MKYANNDYYKGKWIEDELYGEGSLKFANGDIFEGEFEEN